jgi:serine/threonine protein kinase
VLLTHLSPPCSGKLPRRSASPARADGISKSLLGLSDKACRALASAHAAKVLHGDVKPDNFMAMTDNGQTKMFLIDYGFARLMDPGKRWPSRGMTPAYASPEVRLEASHSNSRRVHAYHAHYLTHIP